MQVKKQQLKLDMEQQTGSKLGKEYIKAIYCHCAYLIICRIHHAKCQIGWSTSWNQDCRRNINNLRYADDTTLMGESKEELRASWWKWKGRVKSWFKTQHSKYEDHGIQSHQFSSVQFSRSVVSNSLQPHESQHSRPSCPSPNPRVYWTHVHRDRKSVV